MNKTNQKPHIKWLSLVCVFSIFLGLNLSCAVRLGAYRASHLPNKEFNTREPDFDVEVSSPKLFIGMPAFDFAARFGTTWIHSPFALPDDDYWEWLRNYALIARLHLFNHSKITTYLGVGYAYYSREILKNEKVYLYHDAEYAYYRWGTVGNKISNGYAPIIHIGTYIPFARHWQRAAIQPDNQDLFWAVSLQAEYTFAKLKFNSADRSIDDWRGFCFTLGLALIYR